MTGPHLFMYSSQGGTAGAFSRITGSLGQAVATLTFDSNFQNQPSGHGRAGAWVAKYRNTRQWLQVDLRRPAKVTGVATQGRHDYSQWVTRYTVSYSLNVKRRYLTDNCIC